MWKMEECSCYSDLLDSTSLTNLINNIKPDEIYNSLLNLCSSLIQEAIYTSQTSTVGPVALLEVVKNSDKKIKYYQASSSEMYRGIDTNMLNEDSNLFKKPICR